MRIITTYLFLLITIQLMAQKESLTPLTYHTKMNKSTNQSFLQQKAALRISAISLPFFEDFYQHDIYPNPALWQDNLVFINTTFPKETVSVGVATFDGTNASGVPYNTSGNTTHGPADMLTSNPIDLSGLSGADNVFLSFYFIQGDFGESPAAPNDLLTVQYKDTSGNWNIIWQVTALDSASLQQVFLKVDSIYLNANFQFRFQSFGNLNGANDTWHIDYVKLDKNRDTASEKNIKEMAYAFLPPSLLKQYYVMPYNQFDTTDLADTVSLFVKNNFINTTTDIVDFYEATDVSSSSTIATFSGPSRDFGPITLNKIDYPKFNIPTNLIGDTVVINVDYHFNVSAEAGEPAKVLANNAVSHQQVFSNYFAYDDGSAERGYLVGDLKTNTGMDFYKMAVKYGLRNPDTLQAIKLQFFPVKPNNHLAVFSVCVWKNFTRNTVYNDNDLIYQETNLKIEDLVNEYGVDTINGFYYAPIKPQFVKNGASYPLIMDDTFVVGLIVDNKLSLVVGFDRNNIRSSYNYYVEGNTNKWRESGLPGTMMINPVMGKALPGY
ncbi:MAG TPA: hypothetical protein PK628_10140, partial [Chitinophagales bacterium]|nr:hypothetical protein [Chitinophagales bacterium]